MAGRSLPPARSFSRPRRAAARRWPGSAGNALGGVPGGLTAPGHRAAPCTPRTAGSLHAACRPRGVRCAAPRQAGTPAAASLPGHAASCTASFGCSQWPWRSPCATFRACALLSSGWGNHASGSPPASANANICSHYSTKKARLRYQHSRESKKGWGSIAPMAEKERFELSRRF